MTLRQEIIIGAIAITVLLVSLYGLSRTAMPSSAVSGQAKNATTTIPAFTKEIQAQLAVSHGFQALVSYTDNGFEPTTVTIKKGDAVRFTNNSSHDVWIASDGQSGLVYPAGDSARCGQSAFDSCRIMQHGEFWEFTFSAAGTWGYQNNRDTKMRGIVHVQ